VKMRWDAVPKGCHHQKSYVVDGEVAFVGGINATSEARSSQEHRDVGFHDLFAEIRGPAVADVARNFAERWNQASVTQASGHAFPSLDVADDVVAAAAGAPAGRISVQIVRTLPRKLYRGTAGWLESERFELFDGEESVRISVLAAIAQARRRLYLENQFLMDPETIDAVAEAGGRGVEVVAVVPLEPDPNLLLYPEDKMRETREALARLANESNVGLFGLVHEGDPQRPIYVHAKLLIADDHVLHVGSANLWPPSYWRDSELNVVAWNGDLARETRSRLWNEHLLGSEATSLGDWRRLARESADARSAGRRPPARLVEIDPARYYIFAAGTVAPWQREEAS